MTLGWGIAGTGRIARDVGRVMASQPGHAVAAVGSRELGRAAPLAVELGATGHPSYAAMVHDPAVQAVYVATPHAAHAEVVELALAAGKGVLCEKPMTHDLGETVRLVGLAAGSGTFLMEGMWMRFNPLVQQLRSLVEDGSLGTVLSVQAAFGFVADYDESSRLWDPWLGGGALLDLGVYPVDLARLLLGDPVTVTASGTLAPTGVDSTAALLLAFAGGAHALLEASLLHAPPGTAVVTGTRARALLGPSFHAPMSLVVEGVDARVEHTGSDRMAGFRGEIDEVARCLRDGLLQSEVMPLGETVATMRVLDLARRQVEAQSRAAPG